MSPFHSLALPSFSRLAHDRSSATQLSRPSPLSTTHRSARLDRLRLAQLLAPPPLRLGLARTPPQRRQPPDATAAARLAQRACPSRRRTRVARTPPPNLLPPPSSSCLIEHHSLRLATLHSPRTSIGPRPRAAHPRRRRRCLHAPPSCLVVPHSPHLDHRRARQHVPVRRRPLVVVVVVVARPRATPLASAPPSSPARPSPPPSPSRPATPSRRHTGRLPHHQPRTRPSASLALPSSSAPCRQSDRLCRASNSLQPDAQQRHFAPIVATALLARPVQHTHAAPTRRRCCARATHEPVLSLHLVVADLATDNLAPAARPHRRSTCTTSHPPTTLRPQRRSAFVITSRRRHATAARRQQRRLHQRLTLPFSNTLDPCRRSPHTPLADTSRRHKSQQNKRLRMPPPLSSPPPVAHILVDALLAHHRRRRALVDAANARRTGRRTARRHSANCAPPSRHRDQHQLIQPSMPRVNTIGQS